MKTIMTLFLTIVTPVFVPRAPAQTTPAIGVSVYAAPQPDAPLRVVGFRRASDPSNGPDILVQNMTDRPIAGFMLETASYAPCSFDPDSRNLSSDPDSTNLETGRRLEMTALGPHQTVAAAEHVLGPAVFVGDAKHMNSPFVHSQVGVVEVQFLNGDAWRPRLKPFGNISLVPMFFATSLADSDIARCKAWPTSSAQLKDLAQAFRMTNSKTAHRSPVGKIEKQPGSNLGYFMTCPLGRDSTLEKDIAYCPEFVDLEDVPK